jgi:phage host-nuclease inhibitor protein Gam
MGAKAKAEVKIKNWEEATDQLALYREAVCARNKKRAAMEDALRKVAESYATELHELEAEVDAYAADLRGFAESRKRDFVAKEDGGEGRTRFRHGVEMGWRWGKPYIQIPKRYLEAAIAGLEEISADTYVKRDPKVMKDALKAAMEKAKAEKDMELLGKLAALHISLDQDEEFVLELVNSGQ